VAVSDAGSLVELWRYPFKSMLGEPIDAAVVGSEGIPGDRAWACRDEVRGGIQGAKKFAALMRQRASYDGRDVTAAPDLFLSDGSTVRADAPDAAARLSALLGHPVTVWPRRPAEDLDHYRRGAPDLPDRRADTRARLGLDDDDPFPDFSVMPADDLARVNRFAATPGTYFDAYPLLLVSRQSLAALARRAPGSAVDVRRFRPNLVVDLAEATIRGLGGPAAKADVGGALGDDDDDDGAGTTSGPGTTEFPEQALVGRHLEVGDAVVEIVCGCIRCVMISRPTAELPEDRSLQKVVVRQLHHTLGVYCRVTQGGRVAVGDAVRVRPT
jgi:uncharacterized protein YcbX